MLDKRKKSKWLYQIIIVLVGISLLYGIEKGTKMKLPVPRYKSEISVEQAISDRRSIRDYKDEALTLEEVSQLLWSAQGKTSNWGGRAIPSAGATYPLEIYLVAGKVKGLDVGVYHYQVEKHELEKLNNRDIRSEIASAAWRQGFIASAPVVIIIAADYQRTTSRYGNRGTRYVDNEVGHCGQNIHLQAEALGLGTVVIGAFQDTMLIRVLSIKEEPLYIMPVGRKKD
jgi:SagB-type dehydrogenase family enzyme